MGNGAPGFLFEQVQDDEVLVLARKEEAGDIDGLALSQRRDLKVGLVILEGKDGQRQRLVEAVFGEEAGEDGSHLLEAEGDFAPFLVAGVRDDREVRGMDFDPRRLLGRRRGCA
jgi:hypothetical protein